MHVNIIGAGLAGSEAAYQLANQNIKVKLYEMRPVKMTDAHQTDMFAELVCSNSLRSDDINNAVGLLKYEMEEFGSLIIQAAKYAQLPAGGSLAVDRINFSKYIQDKINNHPNIEVIREEVININLDEYTIVAAGPLASDSLFKHIQGLLHQDHLHFFDAIAPIIEKDSIDMNVCYLKNRYDKGKAAYINCPMSEAEYDLFYNELLVAERVAPKGFEKNVFEGCMPVEVIASRGRETLTFGPLKPVGLETPEGIRPYAVIQLRQDDAASSMYNIVGFQTSLTWGEQKRIINLIPGLDKANIIRYGVIHRNTYIESPEVLNNSFQVKDHPKLFFAGQISGVEGYVESAASGLNVAIQLTNLINNNRLTPLPETTMMGAMSRYISIPNASFKPINANFGIIPELGYKHKKKERRAIYATRAITDIKTFKDGFRWNM